SLAKRGADVLITYQAQRAAAESVVKDLHALGRKAVALRLDAGKSETFAAFVAEVRGALSHFERTDFDYLVNNAGHGAYASFAETTEDQFDSLMAVHVKAPFFLTQRLLPLVAD